MHKCKEIDDVTYVPSILEASLSIYQDHGSNSNNVTVQSESETLQISIYTY